MSTGLDPEARRLEESLLDFLGTSPAGFVTTGPTRAACYGQDAAAGAAQEARFEALALALFEHQAARLPLYRAYAEQRGRPPGSVRQARCVPALPVEAFRRARVATFPPERGVTSFHTSGTTGEAPGILELDGLALYDLALERGFRHHVLPDRERMRILVLAPHPGEAPHSSLSYMLERVRRCCGDPGSSHFVHGGAIDTRGFASALLAAGAAGEVVCLVGTTFGWVQVLDAAAGEGFRVALPAGSRLFETGGTKGRTRAVDRAAFRRAVLATFGIPPAHVVGEYGMTEMGSQLYTLSLRAALLGGPTPDATVWSYPAWLRPRLVDAESGEPVDFEDATSLGLLAHHDLANRSSVAHLLTSDLGRPRGASFELLGRCPRAEPRGCGLVFEGAVS